MHIGKTSAKYARISINHHFLEYVLRAPKVDRGILYAEILKAYRLISAGKKEYFFHEYGKQPFLRTYEGSVAKNYKLCKIGDRRTVKIILI